MRKIEITKEVKELSHQLSVDSINNVQHYFPIDRFFIEENGYLEKILSVDYLEFLLCNLEKIDNLYPVQLFVCLPELWKKVTHKDIIDLIENFTSPFPFYSLIKYTYAYIEIDLFDEIISNDKINISYKKDCVNFFIKTLATLYLDDYEYFELEKNLFGINLEQLENLRKKFKNLNDFKKAVPINELYERLQGLKKAL